MIKNILAFTGISALLLGMVYLGTSLNKKETLPFFKFDEEKMVIQKYASPLKDFHKVGYWSFTNQRGNVFNPDSLEGKIYVADYFFIACPGICKDMGIQMKRLYDDFKHQNDLIFISHTSKPDEDSIENLKEYADSKGVKDNRWIFLTGEKKELFRVARDNYFIINFDDPEDDFVHTEKFVLVDQNKYIRGYYDGTDSSSVNQLKRDINLLFNSAD
ncbi:MAG: SCO family protein [Cytophagales bacterium]